MSSIRPEIPLYYLHLRAPAPIMTSLARSPHTLPRLLSLSIHSGYPHDIAAVVYDDLPNRSSLVGGRLPRLLLACDTNTYLV
ncbi:hypothetical protein PENSPDRAFT_491569 [Peniophora sp. CONT]|nr:hypothetical protein PENSPDRAFT_491569 [Peniophora sp. CONT]